MGRMKYDIICLNMTKNLSYMIKLTYDKTYKGYVADVVNLCGCMSQGKTKKAALKNAEKAISAYMKVVEKSDNRDEMSDREVLNVPFAFA